SQTGDGERADPDDVTLLFDYKKTEDGILMNPGIEHKLAEKGWELDSSPYHVKDLTADPNHSDRPCDYLDYTFVRLRKRPGAEPVGKKIKGDQRKRGWIAMPAQDKPYGFPSD